MPCGTTFAGTLRQSVEPGGAVGGAEKSYDFPPHVVHVKSTYGTQRRQEVTGTLTLRDSPWDPIKELLPIESDVSARLWTPNSFDRDITLAGKIDAEAYAPFADTIGGSRWPGENGGPKKR